MIVFAMAVALLVGFAFGMVWEGARRGGTLDWERACWTAEDAAADLHDEARVLQERIGAALTLCDEAEASPLRSLQVLGQLVSEALSGQTAPSVPEQVSRA